MAAKFYAKVMSGSYVQALEIEQDLGIEIYINGRTFSLAEDNHGRLTLRSIDDVQLVILPQGSNTAIIKSE